MLLDHIHAHARANKRTITLTELLCIEGGSHERADCESRIVRH
jgi:hypothetical protein